MIFHENRLPADDSHEISCLICYFLKRGKIQVMPYMLFFKKRQNLNLSSVIGGALWINH